MCGQLIRLLSCAQLCRRLAWKSRSQISRREEELSVAVAQLVVCLSFSDPKCLSACEMASGRFLAPFSTASLQELHFMSFRCQISACCFSCGGGE